MHLTTGKRICLFRPYCSKAINEWLIIFQCLTLKTIILVKFLLDNAAISVYHQIKSQYSVVNITLFPWKQISKLSFRKSRNKKTFSRTIVHKILPGLLNKKGDHVKIFFLYLRRLCLIETVPGETFDLSILSILFGPSLYLGNCTLRFFGGRSSFILCFLSLLVFHLLQICNSFDHF